MPTAETLALALEIAERDTRDARAALAEQKAETERQRQVWASETLRLLGELEAVKAKLAARAASRARRDKRYAARKAVRRLAGGEL